ncbi:hypothetical protein GCM10007857_05560 [Bradyrhizobium iriomotense]|uniref:Uncharacterized protein n=1 Tax=Bradyrhizobium iriomotense TaxID=441950 RepID=A0ABQ6AQK5_9BRAD|nr:hypothetical protein GCM10007857_05560 [Bradyrhizobium iriomotense]
MRGFVPSPSCALNVLKIKANHPAGAGQSAHVWLIIPHCNIGQIVQCPKWCAAATPWLDYRISNQKAYLCPVY